MPVRSLGCLPGPRVAAPAALAAAVAGVDIVTKRLAERELSNSVAVMPGLRLELGYNSGVAFGALRDLPAASVSVLVAVLVVGLVIATWRHVLQAPSPAIGLLLGGAVANLIDRVGDGRVTDFVRLPNWPAFSVADIAITCAVVILLWHTARPGPWSGHRADDSLAARREQPTRRAAETMPTD